MMCWTFSFLAQPQLMMFGPKSWQVLQIAAAVRGLLTSISPPIFKREVSSRDGVPKYHAQISFS
jgi:hypothetical protein